MKKDLSLSEIKMLELEILKHFKSFCNENKISFYLSNGTLLGAVKYGGFIPWDDDIDVFVPREDYDRLVKIYKDSDRFKLFSSDRDENFRFTFAKLCDVTTLKTEKNIDNGVDLGVDIDIFPLDTCSDHIFKKTVQFKLKLFQNGCILSKFLSSKGKPFHKRLIIDLCRLVGFKYFSDSLIDVIKKEISLGSTYAGCLMWPVYGKAEIIPADVFADAVDVTFEGESFPAPVGYDIYLRSLYGNYHQDPPKEAQKTHHSFEAFQFDC